MYKTKILQSWQCTLCIRKHSRTCFALANSAPSPFHFASFAWHVTLYYSVDFCLRRTRVQISNSYKEPKKSIDKFCMEFGTVWRDQLLGKCLRYWRSHRTCGSMWFLGPRKRLQGHVLYLQFFINFAVGDSGCSGEWSIGSSCLGLCRGPRFLIHFRMHRALEHEASGQNRQILSATRPPILQQSPLYVNYTSP